MHKWGGEEKKRQLKITAIWKRKKLVTGKEKGLLTGKERGLLTGKEKGIIN